MEITRTFGNTFRDMMRAKMRAFRRRSVYRYAIGVAIITIIFHGSDSTFTSVDRLTRGVTYFALLCLFVFSLYVVSASVQSWRSNLIAVTFTETSLVVNHNGELTDHGWDWIVSAGENATMISLLVQHAPRLELYLPRCKLSDDEHDAFRGWLVSHGKLALEENAE